MNMQSPDNITSQIIQITINADDFMLPSGSTVEQALVLFKAQPPYAVLLNGQFLPRSSYSQTLLAIGDTIEVVSAIQGG